MTSDEESADDPYAPENLEITLDTDPAEGLTLDDLQWIDAQHARVLAQLREMRRPYTLPRPAKRRHVDVSPEILAMTRDELITRLDSMTRCGTASFAYDRATELTDEDLRQTLADVLANVG